MKKLRIKLFFTIFLILTAFLLTVSIIFNSESYFREVSSINNNLNMMTNREDKIKRDDFQRNNNETEENKIEPPEKKEDIPLPEDNNFEQRKFLDVVIYTVLLDEDNNIKEIFSHNEKNTSTKEIKKISKNILSTKEEGIYIGNLYIDKYSYRYLKNNSIVIIDNSETNSKLRSNLTNTLIICLVGELLIILISTILTRWIIKPVEDSFNKQKQFIQDASHELKTPLAVIMASSEALERDNNKKWIKSIQDESERMSKLIKNLLDLAKLENFNSKANYKQENISKVIEKQLLTFESILFEKNIEFNYDISENILLNCDIESIKQLVSIIMDNAIKHSVEKGEIKVKLKNEKNNILLEISNKGNPIPKGMEEKIFERFYRADESRNRNDNRYGLGLSIAKNIVINHNGTITATSSNGYTTFKVLIKK